MSSDPPFDSALVELKVKPNSEQTEHVPEIEAEDLDNQRELVEYGYTPSLEERFALLEQLPLSEPPALN